jgi:hypothetical protein
VLRKVQMFTLPSTPSSLKFDDGFKGWHDAVVPPPAHLLREPQQGKHPGRTPRVQSSLVLTEEPRRPETSFTRPR